MKTIKSWESSLKDTVSAISRIFKTVWPDHKGLIMAFFAVAMTLSFVPFVSSGALALLINELIAHGTHGITGKIVILIALLVGAIFLQDLLNSLRTWVDKRSWTNIHEFFELMMIKKRSEIDVATYENPRFQDLLGKATDKSVWPICNLIDNQFQQVTNLVQMVTAAAIFLAFDWRFMALAVLAAIPDFTVELKYGNSSWGIWDEDSQTRRKYSSVRRHFMSRSSLIELKVFQNIRKFYKLTSEMLKSFSSKQRTLETKAFYWRASSSMVSLIFWAITYWWVIHLVTTGQMRIGDMTFLVASLNRFSGSLGGFFQNMARQFEWSRYAKDVFQVLDTKPAIKSLEGCVGISTERPPLIEFRNVSFAYPGTDTLILRDINLTINPGEKLAIIGLNGAGKTTLIKLLMRFYDPTSGAVLINGIDLKKIDLESWWHCIAALFQDYDVYNFPVRESISLGRSDNRGYLTKAVRSAKAVDAHKFIINLEKRYDQMIGKEFDGGVDLSKGQNQKMALARAIYRDPLLMILDEPTASIDASAEAKIFEQLEEQGDSRTQIVISHRFSTVRRSDKICVLQEGRISELGTHSELMANNLTYAELFRLQAKGYIE